MSLERQIEEQLIDKLQSLKYEYRQDIRDRDGLVDLPPFSLPIETGILLG
jgi:hypothetical protein